ncbi:MAG: endonuclease NucS domain-containing protein, partial [Armatimonadota bacterium]
QFMRDNWESIDLGEGWQLYEEDGEPVGYEYKAGDIGYIDLLAHHHSEARWLVIELKRAQSSDDTIGQVLRYMGWVKQHVADSGDTVEGLIIAHGMEPRLRYALECTSNLSVKLYEVDFRLTDPVQ